MTRFALGCAAVMILGACDGDSDDSGGSSGSSGAASSSTTDPSTSAGPSTGDASTTSSSSGGGTSSGDGTSSGGGDSSSGNPNACDPVVPGGWNACVDANGNTDNTLCNWMGTGESVGQAACLNGPTEGSNVCMVRGCEDDCDCFAAPETGNAAVECREVIKGGGMACILNCGDGQTCPDGMTCDAGICFHIPG